MRNWIYYGNHTEAQGSHPLKTAGVATARIFKSQIQKNMEMIKRETCHAQGFMEVLMKQRNSGERWTKEEKALMKRCLRRFAVYVPVMAVFLLPFGMVFLPVLAEILDRRHDRRGSDQ